MVEKATKYCVGYALDPTKADSFMQPSLLNLANERGIDLFPIQFTKPLIDQGPFDCIVHKSYDPEWTNQFQPLSSQYPNLVIIDSPDSIQRLHNRKTMLQVIDGLKISSPISIGTPHQVFVESPERISEFNVPVIAKPLLANGSLGSHQMYLIFSEDGLRGLNLNPPYVLQEFVNHGGVLFKVYVAGQHVRCVKRKSLPDISEEKSAMSEMALPFSQISDVTDQDQISDESVAKRLEEAELPPDGFLSEVASEMRKALGLNLFNFDVIRDGTGGGEERYLVIDINYFPGYAKVPGYETMLTGFFLDVMQQNKQNGVCDGCASVE